VFVVFVPVVSELLDVLIVFYNSGTLLFQIVLNYLDKPLVLSGLKACSPSCLALCLQHCSFQRYVQKSYDHTLLTEVPENNKV